MATELHIHTEAGMPVMLSPVSRTNGCNATTKKYGTVCTRDSTVYAETHFGTMSPVCNQHSQFRYNSELKRKGTKVKRTA